MSETIELDMAGATSVKVTRRYPETEPFTMMRVINTQSSRSETKDLIDLLVTLSRPAQRLFAEIKCNMRYQTYIANIGNEGLTAAQLNTRSNAIKELANAGLAKRLPRTLVIHEHGSVQRIHKFRPGSFMLSPIYIFPNKDHGRSINAMWHAIT